MENLLEVFNLCFESHIVATISDGPNVIKRFVAGSLVEGIFYWNHAIHLTVLDVIYIKKSNCTYSESESEYSDDRVEMEMYCIVTILPFKNISS